VNEPRNRLSASAFFVSFALIAGCSSSNPVPPDAGPDAGQDAGDSGVLPDSGGMPDGGDAGTVPDAGDAGQMSDGGDGGEIVDGGDGGTTNAFCDAQGLLTRSWDDGSTASARGALAGDFTVTLVDGTTFGFQASFTGCESYVFIPDIIPVSQLDSTSVWNADLDALVSGSPQNVHYFFVSLAASDSAAQSATQAMQNRINTLTATLSADQATHWQQHLHVLSSRGQNLSGWLRTVLLGWGELGFCIDRRQQLRGVGDLADVTRYDQTLANAGAWPWKSNLAYAANEAIYMNAQEATRVNLDAETATVIPLFTGQILDGGCDVDVELPSAEQMAGYDTLEIEVTQKCPDPNMLEFNSCGAWDYIANLSLIDPSPDGGLDAGPGAPTDGGVSHELGRFITSYHRETHWVEDISPMLSQIAAGGHQHFQWNFAPPWNTQPTATDLSLRLLNKAKGMQVEQMVLLFTGGNFDSTYDVGRSPVMVQIPSDMKRAELWMLLTGHGNDAYGCAEFCDHQHVFTVNGMSWTVDFPMAATLSGCISMEWSGMVPNQGGTWWTGRGGWCPGGQVDPHIIDVTSQVQAGGSATISYEGLFQGNPPMGMGATIDLVSYLVIYH
jgi:hypothetical protein